MRLCFVGPAVSITFRRWAEWFTDRGHEVTVLTVEPWPEASRFRQINLHCRGPRKLGRLASAMRLAAAIRRLAPDLVHAHYVRGLAWGLLLGRFHPCVATPWGSDVLEEQGAFREWYSRPLTSAVLRRADVVTAHSGYMAGRIQSLCPQRRITRVGWGIDLSLFRRGLRATPEAQALRRRWQLPDRQIIFSPRLAQPFYHHHRLLEALPMVREKVPKAVAVIPEYCPDQAYVLQLRRLAQNLGIADHVRFVRAIPYREMPVWLNLADAAVMLPPSDGMPNTLLEAMACGAIPVLNRLPHYAEWVSHGRNGYLVDPDGDLVGALVGILSDGALRRDMAERNRALVEARGDQDREMMRMESIYQDLT
jgi:glycosyltransferase involved in cell wall biosynthesis